MDSKLAFAHLVDSRTDFYEKRQQLVEEELLAVNWLREAYHPLESSVMGSTGDVLGFADKLVRAGVDGLVVHLPIWADPIFTVKLASQAQVPVLLLGNDRPETSSLVGMLGAGGALDQVGIPHFRVFNQRSPEARREVGAFASATAALNRLRGQTLGLFGGHSLGIFTAVADPAQWQRLFGVSIEFFDQHEIIQTAESLPYEEVERHLHWFTGNLGNLQYGNGFSSKTLEKQVRSYIATRQLAHQHGVDFTGVKCQPELSDGYVTQCVAHLLMNSTVDADGTKPVIVHACESDADGALTMQILHLISGGRPAALLDIRRYDAEAELWTLANCGAMPATCCAAAGDPTGLGALRMGPHVFGRGGGGAITGVVAPQPVTLARLCRRNGEYWMAILTGETVQVDAEYQERVTPAFPKAFVRTSAGMEFLSVFGSNHIHMVSGSFADELVAFCRLAGIPWQIWK